MIMENNYVIYKTSSEIKFLLKIISILLIFHCYVICKNCSECGEGWSMFLRKVRILWKQNVKLLIQDTL